MVDQNSTPAQPNSQQDAQPSNPAAQGMASPSVVQAGQMMLIFALVLIFLVCLAVTVHFCLKRKKRRRRTSKKKPQKKPAKKSSAAQAEPELQSQERKIAELVGTPLCEMGESEPRHEMEDVEVHERYVMPDNWPLTNPNDNPVLVSPLDPDLEAGTMTFGEMTIDSTYQPGAGVSAAYWARAL